FQLNLHPSCLDPTLCGLIASLWNEHATVDLGDAAHLFSIRRSYWPCEKNGLLYPDCRCAHAPIGMWWRRHFLYASIDSASNDDGGSVCSGGKLIFQQHF